MDDRRRSRLKNLDEEEEVGKGDTLKSSLYTNTI